jgi:HK97 family phage portal protein
MSRVGDALRVFRMPQDQRDASLGSLLGDDSRYRRSRGNVPAITQDTAFRNSVWWACLNLRAKLESSFPIDIVRPSAGGLLQPVTAPPFVRSPYPRQSPAEFIYASRIDKDRYGNSIGIIRQVNSLGLPSIVEQVEMSTVRAIMNGSRIKEWRIGNVRYSREEIWHERQYVLSGFDLGLSPLAYASYTMGISASAQDLALTWFSQGASPRGVLKNLRKDMLDPGVREEAKEAFRNSTADGDIFVTGNEWEWTPAETTAASIGFLDQVEASNRDLCRYLDVPAEMVGVETTTGSITYANVTQANLQFLIHHMGPAVKATEDYWSTYAIPKPWQFKLNTSALLRMDDKTRTEILTSKVSNKILLPNEARALDNLPPYTPEDLSTLALFAKMGKPEPSQSQPQQKEWTVPA